MFLTQEDISQMTGYKIKSKQKQWLKKSGVRFTVNRYGHPLVHEKHIEELLCDNTETPQRNVDIDEDALMELMGNH